MTSPGPIRREIRVQSDVTRAFELFTGHIGKWWPVDDYSVYKGSVAFEGMEVVERLGDQASVWAEVTEWNPPHSLALAWHPGQGTEVATDVRVTFETDGEQTLVSLIHDGWERMPDPAAAADEYGHGWPGVLARFAALADPGEEADDRWFALVHRPGPALPAGESIFAHPAFREHVAFLRRIQSQGLLVAAGPLPDEDGAGMTIVRVPSDRSDVDIQQLATIDDLCVAGGYLTVQVRPWAVTFTG